MTSRGVARAATVLTASVFATLLIGCGSGDDDDDDDEDHDGMRPAAALIVEL